MTIEQRLQKIERDINFLNSRIQTKMDKVEIKPGNASKIFYDREGRVVGTGVLTVADIPDIPVGKITGLADILLDLGKRSIDHSEPLTRQSLPKLEEEDIPTLGISKIRGLTPELNALYSKLDSVLTPVPTPTAVSSYDGVKVVSFEDNSVMDGLSSRISSVENQINRFATSDVVDSLKRDLEHKADASSVFPGKYNQVIVNSEGIVTSGKNIPMEIQSIDGLDDVLRGKADQDEFVSLQETVSFLVKKLGSNSPTSPIEQIMTTLEELSNRIKRLEDLLDPS